MEPRLDRPQLYVFAISHYCEKARWALDHHGIEYELRHLAPGAHIEATKQLGAPGSSLPLLVAGDDVVHGSAAILDWADARATDPSKRLGYAPGSEAEAEGRAIETRLDDVTGVHVRRYYYSEALVEYPESVRPIFTRDLEPADREALEAAWPLVCGAMAQGMDLGAEQWHDSRRIVEGELDWLDGLLADGRRYLVDGRFSRVDITAASLLAALTSPDKHPTYGGLSRPPRTTADLERWSKRPIGQWVGEMYRAHR